MLIQWNMINWHQHSLLDRGFAEAPVIPLKVLRNINKIMNNFSEAPTFLSDTTPSDTNDKEVAAAWKNLGTSTNAISFGFVATAILVSMFLIMAIFEYLLGSRAAAYQPSQVQNNRRPMHMQIEIIRHDRDLVDSSHYKAKNSQHMATSDMDDISVLMPGEQYPTYLAQPAPLPCTREGVLWPPHEHYIVHS